MKLFKKICSIFFIGSLWLLSGKIATSQLNRLVDKGLIPYGPLPENLSPVYTYDSLDKAFDSKLPLQRANEFRKLEFEKLILESLPELDQKRLKPYIKSILNFSVLYQIDPFWITSIMMVESRFNLKALSVKDARGLMQIKPDTALHIYQLMKKEITKEEIAKNLFSANENIELGVFYLKKLLQNFRLNYNHATMAYNEGPKRLRNKLEQKNISLEEQKYFVKVKKNYGDLTKKFITALKEKPWPFEETYVYLEQGIKFEEKGVNLFFKASSENLVSLL